MPEKPPLITALDTNHDGTIDAGEIANAAASLRTLDKNRDGKLSGDEIRPPGMGPGGPGKKGHDKGKGSRPAMPKSPIMTALDANGDGVIDASEIANAPGSLLKLDKNHDGVLTSDEYRPAGGLGGPGMQAPPSMGQPPQPSGTQPPQPPAGRPPYDPPLPPPIGQPGTQNS